MSDRRMTPFSGRAAHVALRGMVDAPLTEGETAFVTEPLTDLLSRPDGPRDRQLLLGDAVTVIDRNHGHVFVQAAKDGYCGWLIETAVGAGGAPTHWVATPATHLYPEPRVQARERMALSLGSRLEVIGNADTWAETTLGFLPSGHLRQIGDWAADPVSVAESLLGTPYLWGGNSRAGVDCSGLVQLSLHASGKACPGDSDQQQVLGGPIPDGAALQRGDLLFWKGHVAIVVDERRLIHANGHTMSVAYEGIDVCVARISDQGGGPVTARKRV
jgi:cell wall-associated NlpC family hydrolase